MPQPFLRNFHGFLSFTCLPVEISQVVIVATGDPFALSQVEVSLPVAEPAVNAAGIVTLPVPAHDLESFRQRAPIVVAVAGRIGYRVEIVVKTGIAALDVGQDLIK